MKFCSTGTFISRCVLFCFLWVGTNWMYMHALSILDATDVMALFATNVSFVYLLSWVILHDQFVGLRVISRLDFFDSSTPSSERHANPFTGREI